MGAFLYGFMFLFGPVGLYVLLAALPPRAAAWTLGALALLLALAWASWPLALPPLFTGNPRADGDAVALLAFWSIATGAAALMQTLRPWLRAWGRWAYPLAATLLPLALLAVLVPRLAF